MSATDPRTGTDCLIAAHLWDWTVPTSVTTQEELLERFVSERMCNALCIWPDHQPARFEIPLAAIEKYDLPVVFYFYTENVYNWMQSTTWSGRQDALDEYVDHWVDGILGLSRRRPGKVWWSMGHEHYDQSIAHYSASEPEKGIIAARKFASKREAYAFYREWVLTDRHKIHWSAGHIRQAREDRIYRYGVDRDIPPAKYALGHDIGIPATIPYLAKHGLDAAETFFGAGGTVPAGAACLFSLSERFRFYWWECSYVGTGLQPGIAMIRGAAKQYGRKWLMDHSPYSSRAGSEYRGPFARGLEKLGLSTRLVSAGPTGKKGKDHGLGTADQELAEVPGWSFWWPQHDEDGNRMSGLSRDMIQRDWLWGYMHGAHCIFQEAAAVTHFIKVGDAHSGELRLTPYGEAAKEFFAFANDRCPDRGKTATPVALLMDFYHGLDPCVGPGMSGIPFRNGGDFTWGTVPFTDGDRMANFFFDLAFPGQGTWPPREVPWRGQDDYARLLRAGLDERPYERRTVTASTWGDIFDVVLANAVRPADGAGPADADPALLAPYEAVVVLGDVDLSPAWLAALEGFVEAGGRLLVNAAQLPSEGWPAWLGAQPTGGMAEASRVAGLDDGAAPGSPTEDRRAHVVEVTAAGAQVVASTDTGLPVLLRRYLGKGEVWLTTARFLVGEGQMTRGGAAVFERFLRPYDPVAVEGRPLAHLLNRRQDGTRLLTLANLHPEQWIGRIRLPGAASAEGKVRDLWSGKAVLHERVGADLLLHLVLAPWQLSVIEA